MTPLVAAWVAVRAVTVTSFIVGASYAFPSGLTVDERVNQVTDV